MDTGLAAQFGDRETGDARPALDRRDDLLLIHMLHHISNDATLQEHSCYSRVSGRFCYADGMESLEDDMRFVQDLVAWSGKTPSPVTPPHTLYSARPDTAGFLCAVQKV